MIEEMSFLKEGVIKAESKNEREDIPTEELSLKKGLEDIIQVEHKPGEPNISVDIFYTMHETARDFQGLRELLAKTDIYIPEVFGWGTLDLWHYTTIANGERSPDEVIRELKIIAPNMYPSHETRKKEFEALYNTHKQIIMIDIPIGHSLEKKFDNLDQSFSLSGGGDFDTDLKSYKNFLKTIAELQRKREGYILDQFKKKVKETIENTPSLRKKDDVKILMWLGSIHTAISHFFKKSGVKTNTRFDPMPYYFGFENEVIRRYRFNKEVSDELIAKALLGARVYNSIQLDPEDNSAHIQLVLRKIIDLFDFNEIKKIMDKLEKTDIFDLFLAIVQRKNLDPKLKIEFEELFGSE